MKEIKFRQRNKNNGQYHYWGYVKGEWVALMRQDNYIQPQDSEQYTGLKDKRGSEIFEGHIVCGDTALGNCFEVDMGKYEAMRHLQEFSERDYFIAGNIHQNPELLNNK